MENNSSKSKTKDEEQQEVTKKGKPFKKEGKIVLRPKQWLRKITRTNK